MAKSAQARWYGTDIISCLGLAPALYGGQGQDADGRSQLAQPGIEVQRHPWSAGAAPR